jgi:hypothetical protein
MRGMCATLTQDTLSAVKMRQCDGSLTQVAPLLDSVRRAAILIVMSGEPDHLTLREAAYWQSRLRYKSRPGPQSNTRMRPTNGGSPTRR